VRDLRPCYRPFRPDYNIISAAGPWLHSGQLPRSRLLVEVAQRT
jgi:hypothetical protein